MAGAVACPSPNHSAPEPSRGEGLGVSIASYSIRMQARRNGNHSEIPTFSNALDVLDHCHNRPSTSAEPGTSALTAVSPFIQMRVDLRNLVRSQDAYLATQGTYSRRLEPFSLQYLWQRGVTIAILGASGTAGDGILEAALADPDVETIRVITRRITPRMEEGIAAGKVEATVHMDYLDYGAVREQLADVDAVFWAIGISSLGVDEKTYREIHVAFPKAFAREWLGVSDRPAPSFHYISSSDISADSSQMWARVKVEAENTLFDLARGTRLRVIAYRPDYIRPTAAERHLGQNLLYWFFGSVGAAVEATQIGRAMLEVAARGDEFENGDKVSTRGIVRYSNGYRLAHPSS